MAVSLGLAGAWETPFVVDFVVGDEGVVTSEDGDMTLEYDMETRAVTLRKGGGEVMGQTDVGFTIIKWANGARWSKAVEVSREMGFEGQEHLLSDKQVDAVIDHINEQIDIWGLSEKYERKLIERPVKAVNKHLNEVLATFMLEDWHNAIRHLLDETTPVDAKHGQLKDIFNRQLREPLAQGLNDKIDLIPGHGGLTKELEDKLFHKIVDRILEVMVSTTVLRLEKTNFV